MFWPRAGRGEGVLIAVPMPLRSPPSLPALADILSLGLEDLELVALVQRLGPGQRVEGYEHRRLAWIAAYLVRERGGGEDPVALLRRPVGASCPGDGTRVGSPVHGRVSPTVSEVGPGEPAGPGNAVWEAHLRRGRALLQEGWLSDQGEVADATREFKEAIWSSSFDPRVCEEVSEAFSNAEMHDEAMKVLERALAFSPGDPSLEQALRSTCASKEYSDRMFGLYDVIQACESEVQERPGDLSALLRLGEAMMALDHGDPGAVDVFGRAVALAPSSAAAHMGLGRALLSEVESARLASEGGEGFQEARRLVELAMTEFASVGPGDPLLGAAEEWLSKARAALTLLEEVEDAQHEWMCQEEDAEHIRKCREGVRAHPKEPAAHRRLAYALLHPRSVDSFDPSGAEWEEEIAADLEDERYLERCRLEVEARPEDPEAHRRLALACLNVRNHARMDLDRVESELHEVLRLLPTDVSALREFAGLDWESAIPFVRKAARLDPGNPEILALLEKLIERQRFADATGS